MSRGIHYALCGCSLSIVTDSSTTDCVAVNVRGSFLMTKYSLLEMKKRNYGRILLVASIAGKEVCRLVYCIDVAVIRSHP